MKKNEVKKIEELAGKIIKELDLRHFYRVLNQVRRQYNEKKQ